MNKPTPPAASKPSPAGRPSPVAGKPFKMSDEITIIPQGRNTQKTPTTSSVSYIYSILTYSIHIRYIFFRQNHNIHESSCGLCFWASDPLIHTFYKNLRIKVSED